MWSRSKGDTMAHITFTSKEHSFEVETSIVLAAIDDGEKGTKQLCAIDGASWVDITGAIGTLLDLVDSLSERFPHYRMLAETVRQAREIEKEEGKNG